MPSPAGHRYHKEEPVSRAAENSPFPAEMEPLRRDFAQPAREDAGESDTTEPEQDETMVDVRERRHALLLLGASAVVSVGLLYAVWVGLRALL